jgi:hypothetical protein
MMESCEKNLNDVLGDVGGFFYQWFCETIFCPNEIAKYFIDMLLGKNIIIS